METHILLAQPMALSLELPQVLFGILTRTKPPIPTSLSLKQNTPSKFGETEALMLHVHQASSPRIARFNSRYTLPKPTLPSLAVSNVYTTTVSPLTRSKRLVLCRLFQRCLTAHCPPNICWTHRCLDGDVHIWLGSHATNIGRVVNTCLIARCVPFSHSMLRDTALSISDSLS